MRFRIRLVNEACPVAQEPTFKTTGKRITTWGLPPVEIRVGYSEPGMVYLVVRR